MVIGERPEQYRRELKKSVLGLITTISLIAMVLVNFYIGGNYFLQWHTSIGYILLGITAITGALLICMLCVFAGDSLHDIRYSIQRLAAIKSNAGSS